MFRRVEVIKQRRAAPKTPRPLPSPAPTIPPLSPERLAKVLAGLDKLLPEERKRAEAQRLCPVQEKPLGLMGKPVELTLDGKSVFLCCASCEAEAKADAKKVLQKAEEFKKLPPILPGDKP
jgi:hypothetical protein